MVEQNKFGSGCSHGNCGFVSPSHVLPIAVPGAARMALKSLLTPNSPFKIRPRLDLSLWTWLWRFMRRCNERDMLESAAGIQALLASSRSLYDELFASETIDCEWETRGLLFVFRTPAALEHHFASDRRLDDSLMPRSKRFDADALQALEPALKPGLAGGLLYECDAHLRPDRLMTGWRGVLERRGVQIREDCRVVGLTGEAGAVRSLTTPQGELAADAFVFALGAWTPLLNQQLGCKIPIQPGKGYSLTMPRPAVCPTYPMLLEEHRVAVTPMQSGYRLGSTMEFAGYDTTLESEAIGVVAPRREPLSARAVLRAGARSVVRLAADDLRQPPDHRPQPEMAKRLDRRRPQHARPIDVPRHWPADRRAHERPRAAHRPWTVQRDAVLIC